MLNQVEGAAGRGAGESTGFLSVSLLAVATFCLTGQSLQGQ